MKWGVSHPSPCGCAAPGTPTASTPQIIGETLSAPMPAVPADASVAGQHLAQPNRDRCIRGDRAGALAARNAASTGPPSSASRNTPRYSPGRAPACNPVDTTNDHQLA